MTRWRKSGESGYLSVLEEGERFCIVERHTEDGAAWTRDRVPRNKARGGPRGYVREGDSARPLRRVTHKWGQPVRADGGYVARCACGTERQEVGNGGRWLYRVKGGTWAPGAAPKCEARP